MLRGLKILLLLFVLMLSRVGMSYPAAENGSKDKAAVSTAHGFAEVTHLLEMPVESPESEDFSEKIGRQLNAVLLAFSVFFDLFLEESEKVSLTSILAPPVTQDKLILNSIFRI